MFLSLLSFFLMLFLLFCSFDYLVLFFYFLCHSLLIVVCLILSLFFLQFWFCFFVHKASWCNLKYLASSLLVLLVFLFLSFSPAGVLSPWFSFSFFLVLVSAAITFWCFWHYWFGSPYCSSSPFTSHFGLVFWFCLHLCLASCFCSLLVP